MPEELRSIEEKSELGTLSGVNAEKSPSPQIEEAPLIALEGESLTEGKLAPETNQLAEILQKAGPVIGSTGTTGSVTDDARNLSLLADVESQVTRLLDLATQKGLPHAVHVAQKMKDYYLLDRMHDEMVDKFYQGLVEKGLAEKS